MDSAGGIGIPVAFGAGLISFLSPCVLPLVPGYISAVAGGSPEDIGTRRVIGPALSFVFTFSIIFIALGLLGEQTLRGALKGQTALRVSGIVIILMGLIFLLSPVIPRIAKEYHVGPLMARAGRSGPVLTGAAFALAWTPCTGPTLGAITGLASTSSSAYHGAFLLAVYCCGLAVPFLLVALAFGKMTAVLGVVKRHYPVVIATGGFVLIAMGLLIFTGEFTTLNQTVDGWLTTLHLPNLNSDT
jgi:cytochrome c-type biogenesis protein